MGRKAKWFGAVKKVFGADSNAGKKKKKSKKESESSGSESLEVAAAPSTPPQAEAVRPAEVERGQSKQAVSSALLKLSGRSMEAAAVIKIQTAFRGYLARRALHALKGLVRLKSLINGDSVKRQAATTLRCMQTLARVQSQIHTRRVRMSEENQALQRQLLLKNETELERSRMGDGWDDSAQSKEQIETSLLNKQEAALRRERALAYAFSHQWKNSSKSALFMDPRNPHWGWSWLERWMAARPSDSRTTADKDPSSDHTSVKSIGGSAGGEIIIAHGLRDTNSERTSPAAQKPVRPPSSQSPRIVTSKAPSLAGKVLKSESPRNSWPQPEDSPRSMTSMQSERYRRHSSVARSVGEDATLASLPIAPPVPSYMVPTQSAKAKSRFQSALTEMPLEKSYAGSVNAGSVNLGSAKKRSSFPLGEKHAAIPPIEVRRHSGPPKVGIASVKDVAIVTEQNENNDGSI